MAMIKRSEEPLRPIDTRDMFHNDPVVKGNNIAEKKRYYPRYREIEIIEKLAVEDMTVCYHVGRSLQVPEVVLWRYVFGQGAKVILHEYSDMKIADVLTHVMTLFELYVDVTEQTKEQIELWKNANPTIHCLLLAAVKN